MTVSGSQQKGYPGDRKAKKHHKIHTIDLTEEIYYSGRRGGDVKGLL